MRAKIFGRFSNKSSEKTNRNANIFQVTLEEILAANNNITKTSNNNNSNNNNLDLSHVFLQALESLRELV
jgi:hypothetical protein